MPVQIARGLCKQSCFCGTVVRLHCQLLKWQMCWTRLWSLCQAVIVIDVSSMNLLSARCATECEAVINQAVKSNKNRFGKKKFVVACRCAEKLRGLVTWEAVILSFTERSLSLRLGGCCASRCVRPVCYASAFLWNCRRRRVCDSEEATACWDEQCDALPYYLCLLHVSVYSTDHTFSKCRR